MSTDNRRPTGRRDQRRPGTVPPQRTPLRPRQPPRPHHWFAERLVAVLSGQRPVHWMLGHTIGDAYDQLAELAPGAPLSATRGSRPVVRRCRGAQPATGVVEAFASITAGDRVQAMAFRLEQGTDLRWRCAAVELGAASQAVR
ncbi:Rv3235 family protein [Streptomyces sp. BE308]|uniref:Rv3235 family protein n=1 Tax=Streptomyces sp. BE308 TaxID=3002529 RepID=UPI002E76A70B|nr:Rv3235 family protein [Streptomyces sp. BE308]MEE1789447.1 Rv3235 family protein [Streptomyces sp. BE308]